MYMFLLHPYFHSIKNTIVQYIHWDITFIITRRTGPAVLQWLYNSALITKGSRRPQFRLVPIVLYINYQLLMKTLSLRTPYNNYWISDFWLQSQGWGWWRIRKLITYILEISKKKLNYYKIFYIKIINWFFKSLFFDKF